MIHTTDFWGAQTEQWETKIHASNSQGTFRGHKFYEENNTEHLRMVGEERDTHTGGQGKGQRRKHLRRARSRQPPPRPVPVRTSAET